MVESRIILNNILAGITTGIIIAILFYLFTLNNVNEFIYQLTIKQLVINGLDPHEAAKVANQTLSTIKGIEWIYPLGIILNMFLISIILGIINDYILRKTSMKPYMAAIITGLVLLLVFHLLPLALVSATMGKWIIDLYNKYIGFHIQVIMTITYTILLTIFTSFKGPWSRILESKPKIY